MRHRKHNQFMKTYKMSVSFNLNNAGFPPLHNSIVSKPVSPVSPSLSCTTVWRAFYDKVSALSFKSLSYASMLLPRATHHFFFLETLLLSICTNLHNPSCLILLIIFQLDSNTLYLQICHVVWIHPCYCEFPIRIFV